MLDFPDDFTLNVHREGTMWVVTSPELPGLLVAEHDPLDVLRATPNAIHAIMTAELTH